jgi:DNA-binding protein H-NS
MAKADLKSMDVDELLKLRADVERVLTVRARDLERQIALLGRGEAGRPTDKAGRASALRGKTVAPKYRGPDGETWAGRGAMPRWLSGLIKQGHTAEEFLIGPGGRRKPATLKRKATKKAAKPARKPRQPKEPETKAEAEAA